MVYSGGQAGSVTFISPAGLATDALLKERCGNGSQHSFFSFDFHIHAPPDVAGFRRGFLLLFFCHSRCIRFLDASLSLRVLLPSTSLSHTYRVCCSVLPFRIRFHTFEYPFLYPCFPGMGSQYVAFISVLVRISRVCTMCNKNCRSACRLRHEIATE